MASKKLIIAVDVDDVLANSTESLRLVVNERFGADLQPEHYRVSGEGYHGYYAKVWADHGVVVDYEALNPQMVADQSHVQPHEGAREVLGKLKEKYRLVVVTARNVTWKPATLRWLELYFPNVFEDVLFSSEDPEALHTKGEVCKELGASYLIDDNVDHAKSALEAGVGVVLFGSYGWHHDVPSEVVRCQNWNAVEEYFGAL